MQRFSPSKSRDKPLPLPRRLSNGQEQSQPLTDVSNNRSPTKLANSGLRALLRYGQTAAQKTSRYSTLNRRRSMVPSLGIHNSPRPPMRKSYERSLEDVHLEVLSEQVSDLEAQLQKARREIHDVSRQKSYPTPIFKHNLQVDPAERNKRRHSSSHSQQHGSLTKDTSQHGYYTRHSTAKTLTYKSTDDVSREPHEDEILDRKQMIDDGQTTLSPGSLKRKRSELRQASWDKMQRHLQEQNASARVLRYGRQTKRNCPPTGNIVQSSQRDVTLLNMNYNQASDEPSNTFQISMIRTAHSLSHKKMLANKTLPEPPHETASAEPLEPSIATESGEWVVFPLPPQQRRRHSLAIQSTSNGIPLQKRSSHRRRSSLIIARDDINDLIDEHERMTRIQTPEKTQHFRNKSLPPSPSRRGCPSPIRLDSVEEEFEWPEDVF